MRAAPQPIVDDPSWTAEAEAIAARVTERMKTTRFTDSVVKVVVAVLSAALIGFWTRVDDHERRVQYLENTRANLVDRITALSVQLEVVGRDLKAVTERLIRIEAELKK